MRKFKLAKSDIDELKSFLSRVGKRFFDNGKKVYYADYNGIGCCMSESAN